MSNMDAKQTKIVIVLLVIVVLFVAIRFGYTPIIDKANTVKTENRTLESELIELKTEEANKETLQKAYENTVNELELIKRKYPAAVTPEKTIKFMKDMEVATGTTVTSVAFNPVENIYSSSFVNDNGENLIGYLNPVSITYEASYDGLKSIMDYINKNEERMNIREFSAAYNQETGKLTGNMLINRYSVSGLGKEYEPPVISNVKISTSNIFSSVK